MNKRLNDIDTTSEQGKMLLAAIAKISTESQTNKTPDQILTQVYKLRKAMFTTDKHK